MMSPRSLVPKSNVTPSVSGSIPALVSAVRHLRRERHRRLALQEHRRHPLREVALLVPHRHQELDGRLPVVRRARLVPQEEEEPQADRDEQDGRNRRTPVAPERSDDVGKLHVAFLERSQACRGKDFPAPGSPRSASSKLVCVARDTIPAAGGHVPCVRWGAHAAPVARPRPEGGEPIRVLWLTTGLGPGGAEQLLVTTARRRDRQRTAVRAAYLLPYKSALVAALEAEAVPVECLGYRDVLDLRWLGALRRSMLRDPVDILHAHNPVMAVGGRIVARSLPRRLRPRLVVTDHNVWHGYRAASRWADGLTSRWDDARFTVSEAVRASLPAPIQLRANVVVQGIEVEQVQAQRAERAAVRAELGLDPDALVVGTVANLRAQKAYPDLLAAAAEVLERLPDARFVAVGQGPLEAEIRPPRPARAR